MCLQMAHPDLMAVQVGVIVTMMVLESMGKTTGMLRLDDDNNEIRFVSEVRGL